MQSLCCTQLLFHNMFVSLGPGKRRSTHYGHRAAFCLEKPHVTGIFVTVECNCLDFSARGYITVAPDSQVLNSHVLHSLIKTNPGTFYFSETKVFLILPLTSWNFFKDVSDFHLSLIFDQPWCSCWSLLLLGSGRWVHTGYSLERCMSGHSWQTFPMWCDCIGESNNAKMSNL